MPAYKEYVKEKRKIDKKKKLTQKINIDGGGDHFKISANLIEEKVKPSSPKLFSGSKTISRSEAAKKLKDSKKA